MAWIDVNDFAFPQGWLHGAGRARDCCAALEAGEILYFAQAPFDLPITDREFLLGQKQSGFKVHKNISYRPRQDLLRGESGEQPEDNQQLHDVMRRYSRQVTAFLKKFLAPYASAWSEDFASFRPVEEQGRDLALHKRNDLTHVDAFPTRPTNGGRILRVFTNVNRSVPRVWEITDGFETIAKRFASDAGLDRFARDASSPGHRLLRAVAPALRAVGVPQAGRSAYDRFMLRFHDYLKENSDYQSNWPKQRLEFPPGSTWLVYTDTVPHAVMSGQFALEQTYIVPVSAMVTPERAPIRVLEAMCGRTLSN